MSEKEAIPARLALTALEALAAYKASGLVQPDEHMHEQLAMRLVRIAAASSNLEG